MFVVNVYRQAWATDWGLRVWRTVAKWAACDEVGGGRAALKEGCLLLNTMLVARSQGVTCNLNQMFNRDLADALIAGPAGDTDIDTSTCSAENRQARIDFLLKLSNSRLQSSGRLPPSDMSLRLAAEMGLRNKVETVLLRQKLETGRDAEPEVEQFLSSLTEDDPASVRKNY